MPEASIIHPEKLDGFVKSADAARLACGNFYEIVDPDSFF